MISADTGRWIEDADMEVRTEVGRFVYAGQFSNNTEPTEIIETRPGGRIAWLEAQERTMEARWRREFASMELAEKWIIRTERTAVRRARLPLTAELVVVNPDYFATADPRCVFVPAVHGEGGSVTELWCEGQLLACFPRGRPVAAEDVAEASHVLTAPLETLKESFLSPDGSPLLTTSRLPLLDLDTINWPGKDSNFTSAWSPVHGTVDHPAETRQP